jgi:ParB-like chromosome segregation protein Spo0J
LGAKLAAKLTSTPIDDDLADDVDIDIALRHKKLTDRQEKDVMKLVLATDLPPGIIAERLKLPQFLVEKVLSDSAAIERAIQPLKVKTSVRFWSRIVPRLLEVAQSSKSTRDAIDAAKILQSALAIKTVRGPMTETDTTSEQEESNTAEINQHENVEDSPKISLTELAKLRFGEEVKNEKRNRRTKKPV